MSFHIVFVEPEIPPNTGNIARTCAATGTRLHLIEPMGFSITERAVRRAGLDYWPFTDLKIWPDFASFFAANFVEKMYFVSTRGRHRYADLRYPDGSMFLFGKETAGLDKKLLADHVERTIRIPMIPDERLRSLNLANSANIVLFEALRQQGYPGLD